MSLLEEEYRDVSRHLQNTSNKTCINRSVGKRNQHFGIEAENSIGLDMENASEDSSVIEVRDNHRTASRAVLDKRIVEKNQKEL